MNGIPGEVQLMMLLKRSRTPGHCSFKIESAQGRHAAESHAGRAEPRNTRFLCEPRNFTSVLQCGRERLVDKQRLVSRDDQAGLCKMHASVITCEQHCVHLAAQL